jgi:integrase
MTCSLPLSELARLGVCLTAVDGRLKARLGRSARRHSAPGLVWSDCRKETRGTHRANISDGKESTISQIWRGETMPRKKDNQHDDTLPEDKRRKLRGHGEGSIFYREDRHQWVAQITLENGKTRQRYRKTRAEAAKALQEMLHDQQQGTLVTEKDQTVKQYLEHWIEHVHKKTIRQSSYTVYRGLINNHIIPELGHLKLQRLTIQQVEAFYTRKQDGGLSARTIRQMHGILHRSLAHAVRTNLVNRNVCDTVTLPRLKRHEIQALTVEQSQKFLAAAQGHRLEALFTTAIVTGMREGELLALRWSDINFEHTYLQVCRTVRHITGQGFKENEPKTATSRRKVVLSPFLVEVLKTHRVRQLEARLQRGSAWEEHDLVFCNTYGRYIDNPSLLYTFRNLLREASLPSMRFHDLRHSAASLLLAMGVHAKVVQELLGHSTIVTTLNIYSHVLPSLQQDALDKLSHLFDQQDDQGDSQDGEQKN